jgi:hypothetical protein
MGNFGLRRQTERDAALDGTVISVEKRFAAALCQRSPKTFAEAVETALSSLPSGITGLKPRC